MRPYDILKVKNSLAKSVYHVMECSICSVVMNAVRFSHVPNITSEGTSYPEGTHWHVIGLTYSNDHVYINSFSY